MAVAQPRKDGTILTKSRSLFPINSSVVHSSIVNLYIVDGPLLLVEYTNKIVLHSLHCQNCFSTPFECNTNGFHVDGVHAETVDGYRTCSICLLNPMTGALWWWCVDVLRVYADFSTCKQSIHNTSNMISSKQVSRKLNLIPISHMQGSGYVGEDYFLNAVMDCSVGSTVSLSRSNQSSASDPSSEVVFFRTFNHIKENDTLCLAATLDGVIISSVFSRHSSDHSPPDETTYTFTCRHRCENSISEFIEQSFCGGGGTDSGASAKKSNDGVGNGVGKQDITRNFRVRTIERVVFGDDRSLLVVGAERIARTNEDIRQKHCGGDVGGSDIGGKTTVTSSGGSVLLLCGETLTVLKLFGGVATFRVTSLFNSLTHQLLLVPSCSGGKNWRLSEGYTFNTDDSSYYPLSSGQEEFQWMAVELCPSSPVDNSDIFHVSSSMKVATSIHPGWRDLITNLTALGSCGSISRISKCDILTNVIVRTNEVDKASKKSQKIHKEKSRRHTSISTTDQHRERGETREYETIDDGDNLDGIRNDDNAAPEDGVTTKKKRKGGVQKSSHKKSKKQRANTSTYATLSEIHMDKQIIVLRALQSKAYASFCIVSKLMRVLASKRQSLYGLRTIAASLVEQLNSCPDDDQAASLARHRELEAYGRSILCQVRDSEAFKRLLQIQSVPATIDTFQPSRHKHLVDGSERGVMSDESGQSSNGAGKVNKRGLSLGVQQTKKKSLRSSIPSGTGEDPSSLQMQGRLIADNQQLQESTNLRSHSNRSRSTDTDSTEGRNRLHALVVVGSVAKVLSATSGDSEQDLTVVVTVCVQNQTKSHVLSNIHLRANYVVCSQNSINSGLSSMGGTCDTNPFMTRSSVPIKTQSASIDMLRPSEVSFLSAFVRIPHMHASTATSNHLTLTAQRILQVAASDSSVPWRLENDSIPPSLFLSLSETFSVSAVWREYTQEVESSPTDSVIAQLLHCREESSLVADSISWIVRQEERMRFNKLQQSGPAAKPSPAVSRQMTKRGVSKSYCCGLIVVPPIDTCTLGEKLHAHISTYMSRAMHPFSLIPLFHTKHRLDALSSECDDRFNAHLEDLMSLARVRSVSEGKPPLHQQAPVMCYSVMSRCAFSLRSKSIASGISPDVNDTWQAMEALVKSITSSAHASTSLVLGTDFESSAISERKGWRDCFPELVLHSPNQSVIYIRRASLQSDVDYSQPVVDISDRTQEVLEGAVYNLSHFASSRDRDLVKFHFALRQVQWKRQPESSLEKLTFQSSSIRLCNVVLARAVGLAAEVLLREIRIVATAWRDMKTREQRSGQSPDQHFAEGIRVSGKNTDIGNGRIQVGAQLHVANVEVLQHILQRQQIADKVLATLWTLLAS